MDAPWRTRTISIALSLLVVSACGSSSGERLQSPAPTTTTTVAPATTTTLPGDPFNGAIAGTVASVAGVAYDETFDISTLPGEGQPVAASLPALTPLVLTGLGRQIDVGTSSRVWLEVTAGDATGWISQWSLVYPSNPRDVTAETVAAVGTVPTAPTMLELGQIVTDAIVQPDPDFPPAEIVLAAAPTAGPVSEVIYDGFPGEAFGDDVANGTRYRITGREVPDVDLPETGFATPLVYELVSVEAFSLCTRGVDTVSGFCV